ncbi:hypothetical protein A2U01_0067856, partial [Trifolium medium]|nr:hypothetical protein [Trifolium medium]
MASRGGNRPGRPTGNRPGRPTGAYGLAYISS